ncbi:AfsR/SARP family transcriptional regulator [Amycolatopsis sp. 195334CR]|uniref:AfsR/SARP family transcriptional regulator n=1 Tax=Amycolatopsis sp. 195334CR TaxID=2814588 RepID=UPI001A8D3EE9|nr:AfsR/SARP family transcriptional regulator [Amycolatopsis sp. 195334CR]MBN6039748.1 AAA family ATPase [Amycolatopsis sp. 195334CR]
MRFQVLGPVSAWSGGTPIELRGPKVRTVLASLLLAHGRVVSDGRLMNILWDDQLPSTTQAQIQTYASRLRGLLGDAVKIERQPPGYRLRFTEGRDTQVDLVEFEHLSRQGQEALADSRHAEASTLLRAALAKWNGQALAGVTRHLAAVEQPRLEEARLLTLEKCIDAELALGRHESLIAELTALVAAEPLRERPCMQLMTGLHRCGRTADALAVYRSFRSTLVDSLGLDPSREMQELHQSILTSELVMSPAAPVTAGVRLTGPGLRHEPSDFVGRADEAALAFSVLADSAGQDNPPTACAIGGPSGAGKTTLAMRVARQLRHHFPDHQLLVDLGGKTPNPPDPMTVLGTALGQLGLSESKQPNTLYARIDAYRSILSGTRTLVVLDDAADERQVRALHPGDSSCGMLVTSRFPLATLEGTTRISLNVFSPRESVELLKKIAGEARVTAETEAALQIAKLCGQLPAAVRISGAILAARRHWTLAQLAERLADPRRRLAELRIGDLDVRDFLKPAYTKLPDRLIHALSALASRGTRSFTCATAAGVLGESVHTTLDLLDELVAAHFLTVSPAVPSRYQLPELVAALAVTHSPVRCAG